MDIIVAITFFVLMISFVILIGLAIRSFLRIRIPEEDYRHIYISYRLHQLATLLFPISIVTMLYGISRYIHRIFSQMVTPFNKWALAEAMADHTFTWVVVGIFLLIGSTLILMTTNKKIIPRGDRNHAK